MKRIVDIMFSSFGLFLLSPLLAVVCYLIWQQDNYSPFYIAPRVGENEKIFKMVKLRSMVVSADKTGVDSTSANDSRITPIGHFVLKFKLDEFTQLRNVLMGDMSLVGPRPNVKRETDLYTDIERKLLSIQPGITDFSSIVFSDENDILKGCENPDISYNQLIRPWKSRLGLLYVENQALILDFALLFLTLVALVSKDKALAGTKKLLLRLNASADVIRVSMRQDLLEPFPPPGSDSIVMSRESVCITS